MKLNEEEKEALQEMTAWTVRALKGGWLYRPSVNLKTAERLARLFGVCESKLAKPESGGR